MREHFGAFPPLLEEVLAEMKEFMSAAEAEALAALKIINASQKYMFTQNHYYSVRLARRLPCSSLPADHPPGCTAGRRSGRNNNSAICI